MIYDLVVVGGGPAGLSAAVHAKKEGLSVLVLERGELANTIFDYQKKKHVMAEPGMIPLRSDVPFEAGTREYILEGWHDRVQKYQVQINRPELVDSIEKTNDLFQVKSSKDIYKAKHVILAIGIQGNPNRLGRPGEDLPHVSYKLTDPFIYEDKNIMMVGAGDAAIEGALALCEKNRVSVVNRNSEFYRLKEALERQINEKVKAKQVVAYHSATIERFEPGKTLVSVPDGVVKVTTDLVFIRIGAQLPRPFLEKCGITFSSQDRSALPIISEHYESAVPGLYLIGAVAGYNLIKQGMNQGYEVVEYILGRAIEPVEEPLLREKLSFMRGGTEERLVEIQRAIPLLSEVPKQPLRELILQATLHHVQPGHVVFKENDFSDSLYFVLDGEVGVSFAAQRPNDPPITLRRGAFFGEMSLLAGRRRNATVIAIDPSTLIEVPRKAMLRLTANEPSVKKFVDQIFIGRALRRHLFQDMDEDRALAIARRTCLKSFKKGQVIVQQGDEGDAIYLIRSGTVKVTRQEGQKEFVLRYLPAGEYFGEIALLDPHDTKRTATVSTTTRTEVIQLMRNEFLAILDEFPEYKRQLIETAERRKIDHVFTRLMSIDQSLVDHVKGKELDSVYEGTDVLLIDESKCVRCDNCVKACAATHNGQTRLYRNEGIIFGTLNVPTSCRHCENPLCLTDCPPGDAIQRDPMGEVFVNEEKCIGCGNCAANCPYSAIFMQHTKPKTGALGRLLNLIGLVAEGESAEEAPTKAVKCDLCRHDREGGPACVRSCPTGAAIRVNPQDYFDQIKAASLSF